MRCREEERVWGEREEGRESVCGIGLGGGEQRFSGRRGGKSLGRDRQTKGK